ncbi:IS607 family transposase, partial [Ectobacillus polymachus]|uniref:IS607 family transposase n=1 Tax=Ectobacillus polymachus TaxID=1508806 RepID=UPI003A8C33F0
GISQENKVGKTILYARVSNQSQKKDLENQVEFLRIFANAKGWIVNDVLTDIGSGLNYKRKNWNELLEMAQKREVKTILISHKDRFVRFGYEWFEGFLKKCGVKIVVVNNETLSPQEELVQDLISIIHVFSSRIYGLRKYKNKLKEDKEL